MNHSSDKALHYIRERILSGKFPGGSTLPTKNLAEEIGVSRTPIRDALRQLETEGLVCISPRQEARVKDLTFEEYKDICELRVALETHAAQLAAKRRTEEEVGNLQELIDAMRICLENGGKPGSAKGEEMIRELAQLDVRFHFAIMEASRNRLIKSEAIRFQVIQGLIRLPDRLKAPFARKKAQPWLEHRRDPSEVWKSHFSIFEAIRQQNPEKARDAMAEHIEESISRRLRSLRDLLDAQIHESYARR